MVRKVNMRKGLMQVSNYGGILLSVLFLSPLVLHSQIENGQAILLNKTGNVSVASRTGPWEAAIEGQSLINFQRLRTGENSSAALRLAAGNILRVGEFTTIDILPPETEEKSTIVSIVEGLLYFFGRKTTDEVEFLTPAATGAIKGTEINLRVSGDGSTTLTVLDGLAELTNKLGTVKLAVGEQGEVSPGTAPTKSAVIDVFNVVQWCLYYPAVVDLDELELTAQQRKELAQSLTHYREGNLIDALRLYDAAASTAEVGASLELYESNLLLSVGEIDEVRSRLASLGNRSTVANALRYLIAAVTFEEVSVSQQPASASEWLASSYYLQSRRDLNAAVEAARNATELSAQFGYAWIRLAELNFSFGKVRASLKAIDRGLKLSPSNPQAWSLKGFVLLAQNRRSEAIAAFNKARELDSRLANVWLGRGLANFQAGKRQEALRDLETAVAWEPNRALLRNYLAKAFAEMASSDAAVHELNIAERLDPNEPTSALYSALINQKGNRINRAIDELRRSQARNENRSLFRSRLLLDQDVAVRSFNLASVYRDAGMLEISLREASKAAMIDYSSFAAHNFLANSLNEFRDPNLITLRFESAAASEYLIANLISPVGGGITFAQCHTARLLEIVRVRPVWIQPRCRIPKRR